MIRFIKRSSSALSAAAALACGIGTFGSVQGATYLGTAYDGFNYTTGPMSAPFPQENGGSGFAGSWGSAPSQGAQGVFSTAGTLVHPFAESLGNKLTLDTSNSNIPYAQIYRRITAEENIVTDELFYFSFLIRKESNTQRTLNFSFFDVNDTATTPTLYERFAVGQFSDTTAGLHSQGNIALRVWPGGTATSKGAESNSVLINASSPIALTLDQTFLIVGRASLTAGNDTIHLWVNPSSNEPSLDSAYISYSGGDLFGFDTIRPFAGNSSTAPGASLGAKGSFDEVRFGTNYAQVIPEPSAAMLLTVVGGIGVAMRRRRSA